MGGGEGWGGVKGGGGGVGESCDNIKVHLLKHFAVCCDWVVATGA